MADTTQTPDNAEAGTQDGATVAVETTVETPSTTPEQSNDEQGQETSDKDGDKAPESKDNDGDKPDAKTEDNADSDEGDGDEETDESEDSEEFSEAARKSIAKARREAKNLRERLHASERKTARLEAAYKAGLPADTLKFLTGETPQELEDNAADLLAILGGQGRVTPSGVPREKGTGPNDQPPVNPLSDLDAVGARIYGS